MVVLTAVMTLRMIGLWWPQGWARLAFVTGMVGLGVAHALLEGWRWQMGPLYLAAFVVTVWVAIPRWSLVASRIAAGFGFLAIFASFILAVVVPIFRLVPPGGPHAVGTRLYELTDTGRADPEGNGMEPRRLAVQVWYPAVPGTGKGTAAYRGKTREFDLSHLRLVATNAAASADIDGTQPSWPLILFGGDRGGGQSLHTGLVQELASHGYVVATFGLLSSFSNALSAQARPIATENAHAVVEWFKGARSDPQAVLQALTIALEGKIGGQGALLVGEVGRGDLIAKTACLSSEDFVAILSLNSPGEPAFIDAAARHSAVPDLPCPILYLHGGRSPGTDRKFKNRQSGWSVAMPAASGRALNEWPLYLRMKDVTGIDGRTYMAVDALIRRYAVAFADWALRNDDATLLAQPAPEGVTVTTIGTPRRRD